MPASTQEKVAQLARVQLFGGVSRPALERIAELVGEIDFSAGDYIVRQGQLGNGLYIILSGTARVVRSGEDLARLGPGDSFGELAVIDRSPRMANVIADEPVTCFGLASWDLLPLLEKEPIIAVNMLRELSSRVRSLAGMHHRH
ncbi:MAG: cyclic nucleotide-binding domain-containing protein [Candidatus Limnocylindrales bacterium]|nr:cyclic nucleotide-binding domain-containing protein [Chloroflexota bacterium]